MTKQQRQSELNEFVRRIKEFLSSYLFIMLTVFGLALAVIVFVAFDSALFSLIFLAAYESLIALVVWQYLLLAEKIESNRIEEAKFREQVTSSNHYLHRVLMQLSSDQSRILESTEIATKLHKSLIDKNHTNQVNNLEQRLEDINTTLLESFDEHSTQQLHKLDEKICEMPDALQESLISLNGTMSESLLERSKQSSAQLEQQLQKINEKVDQVPNALRESLHELDDQFVQKLDNANLAILQQLRETSNAQQAMTESIATLAPQESSRNTELLESLNSMVTKQDSLLDGISSSTEKLAEEQLLILEQIRAAMNMLEIQAANEPAKAVGIATALDRLNLEFRRQLVLLRNNLSSS